MPSPSLACAVRVFYGGGAGHLRASKAVPVGPAGVGSAVPARALAGGPGGSKSIRRWRHVGHQMVGFGMEQLSWSLFMFVFEHGHCLCCEWSGTSL